MHRRIPFQEEGDRLDSTLDGGLCHEARHSHGRCRDGRELRHLLHSPHVRRLEAALSRDGVACVTAKHTKVTRMRHTHTHTPELSPLKGGKVAMASSSNLRSSAVPCFKTKALNTSVM